MESLSDRALIERLVRKDEHALGVLYDRYTRLLYPLAFRILATPPDAEEVIQDVFLQVWHQAARYDPARGPVEAWLVTLVRSRAIDRLRSQAASRGWRREEARPSPPQPPSGTTEVEMVAAERARAVREAMAALPLLQRIAVELSYFEGLSHTEIGERLEQPVGTVKTRIRLAMLSLREKLKPYLEEGTL
ncbi:MAG: sigma-70 family RNA polymerase sigma factor [Thermoplasmata archaeon]